MRLSKASWADSRMGRIVSEFDWSKNPLGPIEDWPTSLKTIVDVTLSSKFPQAVIWGPEFITIHNDAFLPILGKKPLAIGRSFADIWAEAWSEIGPIADRAYAGEPTYIENFPLRIKRNDYDELAYFTFCYSPLRDDEGRIAGMVDTVIETTDTVRAKQTQDVLRRELVHRVKNTMAVTNAVVSASMRHAISLSEARETITRRIDALGKAQNLISASDDSVFLQDVVANALAPHLDRDERATISGPAARLTSEQATGLSLAIYELATNALKYGALSADEGHVSIRWTIDEEKALRFEWQESGGPTVSVPSRTGFGSRLNNQIVASYFHGKAETAYLPEGLQFHLTGSLAADTEQA
ncbi:histidine kinase [Aliirhizobium terrae]|uniref:sensor histidine kinase n=1 Tax=Terrirhizobium terrae TaxID=2926709 RepID=UPI0025773C6C|nr:PAS domain-containing sensor histidine kinase [Rhizobium sp. CC-CFT758]WJH40926.1 histidine kinase [Rhizobium sp. CC-CFT758]